MALSLEHFKRAIVDIRAHGDNDTLPFDIENRFIGDRGDELANAAFAYAQELRKAGKKSARTSIDSLPIFSERLLVPSGSSGFRITTKIHPFWNIYFNGIGIAIAEKLEPTRNQRAHSYRFLMQGDDIFDRTSSWRAFRESTIEDCGALTDTAIAVQTDISSFYEHISHHRIENCINDLFPDDETVAVQVDRFLSKFAAGRSFGLPVGGQCSRILAELLLSEIDKRLSEAKIVWRRYVDDFVLVATDQSSAYRALSILSHALADYGLTLNRTKTILLRRKHYVDYVRNQLGISDEKTSKLYEIDLHFDPYSHTADADYKDLKELVAKLDIR
ncbi:MAG: RNA-directed DNA polymerase, partial [Anaerolineae bacterium]|nr:RNA-directed DNA polymerase [Anaerolineae bacterium]